MVSDISARKLPADFCGELLGFIDEFLYSIAYQDIVDSNQVQDFCLDLRLSLKDICEDHDE